ncbi:hypothetical protein ACLB2K_072774 [Fragaria x ananassa]
MEVAPLHDEEGTLEVLVNEALPLASLSPTNVTKPSSSTKHSVVANLRAMLSPPSPSAEILKVWLLEILSVVETLPSHEAETNQRVQQLQNLETIFVEESRSISSSLYEATNSADAEITELERQKAEIEAKLLTAQATQEEKIRALEEKYPPFEELKYQVQEDADA